MAVSLDYKLHRLQLRLPRQELVQEKIELQLSMSETVNSNGLRKAEPLSKTGGRRTRVTALEDGDANRNAGKKGQGRRQNSTKPPTHFCEAFLQKGYDHEALQQVVVLLSSDSDEDFCQCVQYAKPFVKHVSPMKCSDGSDDSKFLSTESDTASSSSASQTSSDYIQPEQDEDTESEEEINIKRIVQKQSRATKKGIKGRRNQRTGKNSAKIVLMEKSMEHDVLQQPNLRKETETSATQRKTRGSSKSSLTKQGHEETAGDASQTVKVRRKRASGKQSITVLGKKKGKQVSPAVVDAVFGNLQSCVPDVDELRRKRNEDALKCRRTTGTVGNTSRTTCVNDETGNPSESTVPSEDVSQDPLGKPTKQTDNTTCNQPPTGVQRTAYLAGKEVSLQFTEVTHHSVGNEFPHENTDLISQPGMTTKKDSDSTMRCRVVDMSMHKEKCVDADSGHVHSPSRQTMNTRRRSPSLQYKQIDNNRKIRGRDVCLSEELEQHRQLSYDSVCTTRKVHRYNEEDGTVAANGRRSRSPISPFEQRRSQTRRDSLDLTLENSRSPIRQELRRGVVHRNWEEDELNLRRRSKDSSSSERRHQYKRSVSPYPRHEKRRESPSFRRSRSPSTSLVRVPTSVRARNPSPLKEWATEDVEILSPSVDRRTRRYKRSVRDSQKLQRQTDGKKPFYVTVDSEGRPYGPGRPAWISEINKLAAGLDPSCTDIRKQAHGAICVFKDRLNERFEYSDDLNEDYLRGFMGKAVTRRRTDLIGLINRDGDCPALMGDDIWKRLQKLATSKQRERRTEHGRYANSCRRTLGRTGASGEEGVRQRLLELRGRSPDPDEVANEMQRDKGFGKMKADTSSVREQRQYDHAHHVGKEVDTRLQLSSTELQRFSSSSQKFSKQDSVAQFSEEARKTKALPEYKLEDWERPTRGSEVVVRNAGREVMNTSLKDDYIARLEDELERLRGGNRNDRNVSMRKWSSQSAVSPGEDDEE